MIRIVVRGTPAPQGSKRHVGGGRMIEMSKAVGPWREAVRAETQDAMTQPMTGAISVDITFLLRRPQGHYRTGRYASQLHPAAPPVPAGRPDIDKLCRAVLDGLTEGGAWKDDGQVAWLAARKIWADHLNPAGCVILVDDLEGEE